MALATGGALAWLVAAVGPAGPVTAATTSSTTGSSGGAGLTRTETQTVTEPARTDTVTETSTEQAPSNGATVSHHTASVQVTPVAATTSGQSSGSGLPAWGWVLIGIGAVLAAVAIFMIGRHSGKPPPGGAGAPGSPAPS